MLGQPNITQSGYPQPRAPSLSAFARAVTLRVRAPSRAPFAVDTYLCEKNETRAPRLPFTVSPRLAVLTIASAPLKKKSEKCCVW